MPAKKKVVGKVYHTKTGQPYKIMPNGRARFIKKSAGGKAKKGGGVRIAGGMKRNASMKY